MNSSSVSSSALFGPQRNLLVPKQPEDFIISRSFINDFFLPIHEKTMASGQLSFPPLACQLWNGELNGLKSYGFKDDIPVEVFPLLESVRQGELDNDQFFSSKKFFRYTEAMATVRQAVLEGLIGSHPERLAFSVYFSGRGQRYILTAERNTMQVVISYVPALPDARLFHKNLIGFKP